MDTALAPTGSEQERIVVSHVIKGRLETDVVVAGHPAPAVEPPHNLGAIGRAVGLDVAVGGLGLGYTAQAVLDTAKLTAPFSGTVMAVDSKPGDSVTSATAAISIQRTWLGDCTSIA
jgi:hypothetical protein